MIVTGTAEEIMRLQLRRMAVELGYFIGKLNLFLVHRP